MLLQVYFVKLFSIEEKNCEYVTYVFCYYVCSAYNLTVLSFEGSIRGRYQGMLCGAS